MQVPTTHAWLKPIPILKEAKMQVRRGCSCRNGLWLEIQTTLDSILHALVSLIS